MTKNLKKAVRRLRAGNVITEELFPKNYERAMEIYCGDAEKALAAEATAGIIIVPTGPAYVSEPTHFEELKDAMTEVEFHQTHSVEKEQV